MRFSCLSYMSHWDITSFPTQREKPMNSHCFAVAFSGYRHSGERLDEIPLRFLNNSFSPIVPRSIIGNALVPPSSPSPFYFHLVLSLVFNPFKKFRSLERLRYKTYQMFSHLGCLSPLLGHSFSSLVFCFRGNSHKKPSVKNSTPAAKKDFS